MIRKQRRSSASANEPSAPTHIGRIGRIGQWVGKISLAGQVVVNVERKCYWKPCRIRCIVRNSAQKDGELEWG
jgi:hypothetical protein